VRIAPSGQSFVFETERLTVRAATTRDANLFHILWTNPLYGDLHGLPPLLIYAGGDEVLRDDSARFVENAKDTDVDAALRVGEGLFHCFPVCAPLFPEATRAMEETRAFIRRRLES